MNACSSNVGHDINDPWPGYTFTPQGEPDEFYALLGTPHGRGVTYLLIDHPNELPGKSVESITIFGTISSEFEMENINLLFTLTGEGNS
ncbi:MAG: hypothetical protein HETSPECPRED_005248 [Heterodermia speciosa]|uniref:Uncharacterized protein n=1 Tax=Heterodermia speciosa TaxID=116794 RepID=A0A8H3FGK8_9LECA|nr:MAG: hypothetical protein HETSPECPRED_005248 [Heterodermia speciosa]